MEYFIPIFHGMLYEVAQISINKGCNNDAYHHHILHIILAQNSMRHDSNLYTP